MRTINHAHLVTAQFGPQAAAYVTSTVHATGEDLEHLAALAKNGPPTARILDLGCGGGHVSFHMAPYAGQLVAYDMSIDMLNAVSRTAADKGLRNIITRQGVAEKLPFPDRTFDMVVSRFTAHHWQDFAAGLREARRVLTNGGQAVFIDVTAPESPLCDTHLQTIELLRDMSHVRNYTATKWLQTLRVAGLEPGATTTRRLRLDFESWVTRMRTPAPLVQAIRTLQLQMPGEVVEYLELEEDGSFKIDCTTFETAP
ncbi:MAG: SAM-dependent methyltransferase, partial [Rhodospirillales bacterium]|nr:SAM-dependent methyltransferase [Rhodospirillales bacterium]